MTWKQFLTSSLGKKYVMGLTGFFLITFLIVHVGINSSIFLNDGGETFNSIAHFMSHNWILRFIEVGLFAGFFIHIIQGLILWRQNSAARPVRYHVNKPARSSQWWSRSMGILGTLILLFLIMHISHFYVGTKVALYSGDQPHNLYEEMKLVFSAWWIVVLYVLGVISLFWHLLHGFQSAFQTFGLANKRFGPLVNAIGVGYTVIVCVLFVLMPLSFFFGWIQ